MQISFNSSFTVAFSAELRKKAGIKYGTSPQICCSTTLRKLNVQLCNRLFSIYSRLTVYQHAKFCFVLSRETNLQYLILQGVPEKCTKFAI